MNIEVRTYRHEDVPAMTAIWNQVVEDGIAFPQETLLDDVSGPAFFAEQTDCAVAVDTGTDEVCVDFTSFIRTISDDAATLPTPVMQYQGTNRDFISAKSWFSTPYNSQKNMVSVSCNLMQ